MVDHVGLAQNGNPITNIRVVGHITTLTPHARSIEAKMKRRGEGDKGTCNGGGQQLQGKRSCQQAGTRELKVGTKASRAVLTHAAL